MGQIAADYPDVLGGNDDLSAAVKIYDYLHKAGRYKSLDNIATKTGQQRTFVKAVMGALSPEKMVHNGHGSKVNHWRLTEAGQDRKKAVQILTDAFTEKMPTKTAEYYRLYGFNDLIRSVCRQIDFNGNTVAVYDSDSVWCGRYIDFLELARQYISWRESDNAVAAMMAKKAAKQTK